MHVQHVVQCLGHSNHSINVKDTPEFKPGLYTYLARPLGQDTSSLSAFSTNKGDIIILLL